MLWRCTLRDLHRRAEAWRWRERQAWERTAALGSWLLHAWCTDAPSPAQLLGDIQVTDAEATLTRLVEGETPDDKLARLETILAAQPKRERPY